MASMTNKKKTSFKRTEKYQRTGYKFIAPGLLMMVLLIIYPMLYGAYLSFYNTNLVNKWKFVGFHGRTIFRVIFMLPWLFPETVIALLFTWIMNPMYGVLNSILKSLGIISSNVSWLGSAKFAFPAVVAVCIWKGYPLVMTMILSGLQSISHDLYEAAEIDGANKWQQFLHVTVPGLKPVMTTTLILDSVWWFKQYTLVYTMTGGGPGTATNLISLNIYGTAFNDLRFGKAAAWGIIVFVICYLISKLYRMVLKDD